MLTNFEDVFEDVTKSFIKIDTDQYLEKGTYPVIDQGEKPIAGFTDLDLSKCDIKPPFIVFGDHTRRFKYIDFDCCLGADGAKVLKPKIDADVKFLFYALKNIQLENNGYSRHYKFLKRKSIYLPPLAEQQRIAAILDKAVEIKGKRELVIEKLDRLAQSVFYEMFGDPVANDKGWPMTTMGSLAAKEKYSIVDGPFGSSMKSTDYRESGIPVVRIANVSKEGNFVTNNLLYIDEAKFQDLKRSSIGPNDVLVTRVGTIGNTCVFPADIGKALLSTTGVCKIKPNEDLMLPMFLHKAIKTKSFQDQINRSASISVQKYFNLSALKGWKIIVPPLDEQKVFLGRIKGIEEQLTKSKFSLKAMERTRNSIQSQAFSSKL
jgi:type I restriction enzyme S subunit